MTAIGSIYNLLFESGPCRHGWDHPGRAAAGANIDAVAADDDDAETEESTLPVYGLPGSKTMQANHKKSQGPPGCSLILGAITPQSAGW